MLLLMILRLKSIRLLWCCVYDKSSITCDATARFRAHNTGFVYRWSFGAPGWQVIRVQMGVGGFSTVLTQEVVFIGIKVTVLEPAGMRTDWRGHL